MYHGLFCMLQLISAGTTSFTYCCAAGLGPAASYLHSQASVLCLLLFSNKGLWTHRLIVFGDFNTHAEAGSLGQKPL